MKENNNKNNILVVSRDNRLVEILRQSLPHKGFVVTSTEAKSKGLKETLSEVMPDLVILDAMMPKLEGIETLLDLRQWSAVPIIMLSTWGAAKGAVRGLDLSSDCYLTESITVDQLLSKIKSKVNGN